MNQQGLERDFSYMKVTDPSLPQPYKGPRLHHVGPPSPRQIATSSSDEFPPPPPQHQLYYESDDYPLPPPPDGQASYRYLGYSSPKGRTYASAQTSGEYADVSGLQTGSLGHMFPMATGAKQVDDKEAKVDALTNQLLKNMEATSDPQFLGMCAKCSQKVMGENNGCNAMDRLYHIACFTCVTCNQLLQGQSFFSMESKPFCESCYVNTLEKCSVCSKPITDRLLRATGKPYHPSCFTCVVCGKSLDGIPFTVDATNQIHCIDDFHKKFAPRCCVCQRPIMPDPGQDETVRVVAMDRSFHMSCYRCQDCGMLLSSEGEGRGCYPLDEMILCKNCNAKRIQNLSSNLSTVL